MSLVVGIDIGATWLKAALADGEGRILYKKAERTNREGEELLSQLLRLAGELVARAGPSNVSAVGIGAVG
ncbi:MAG TPA: ROK family protein, partial [Candidatus Bathyarchaeota archaeon]|nr:ROK family protein [Candidatus Bathyarchaeota archaeon]